MSHNHINSATVDFDSSLKLLGTYVTEDLSWSNNTRALNKKAQQKLYFFRTQRKVSFDLELLVFFYHRIPT